jgi:hypothetical protein
LIFKLDYKGEPAINCTFYKIGTLEGSKRWSEPKVSPSYTLVAYIKDSELQPFQEATEDLTKIGHQFKPSKHLHCTLFSLKENLTEDVIESFYIHTKEFFKTRKVGQLKVYFDIIHPGKNKKRDKISDNAVIALSRRDCTSDYGFLSLIYDLENHLANQGYRKIIEKHKTHNTIWCTLGYFDEPQFEVDSATYNVFGRPELRAFSASATFDEIALTEYRLKSLDDGRTIYSIKL